MTEKELERLLIDLNERIENNENIKLIEVIDEIKARLKYDYTLTT